MHVRMDNRPTKRNIFFQPISGTHQDIVVDVDITKKKIVLFDQSYERYMFFNRHFSIKTVSLYAHTGKTFKKKSCS